MRRLLDIMERLRAVDGCPWDRAQTAESILPYTLEECYEVADAVRQGDAAQVKDELGDLLFQVVFQAQIAREAGSFDFEGVVGAITDKLIRRHPHVFAPGAAQLGWEEIKAQESAGAGAGAGAGTGAGAGGAVPRSAVAGVPRAMPALMRAHKLSKRAARVGFDFEEAAATADKVAEELREVREAAAAAGATPGSAADAHVFEEVGDLLFAAANLARKLDVDAEAALDAANRKFERRFETMERLAAQRGEAFGNLTLSAQEALWREVKRGE